MHRLVLRTASALVFVAVCGSSAFAQSLKLAWDAPPAHNIVSEYSISYNVTVDPSTSWAGINFDMSRSVLSAQDLRDVIALMRPAKVGVAVIDSGVSDHPELRSRVALFADFSERTGDLYGHGTHVAGIVAVTRDSGGNVAASGFTGSTPPGASSVSTVASDIFNQIRAQSPALVWYRTQNVVLTLNREQWTALSKYLHPDADGRLALLLTGGQAVRIEVIGAAVQPVRETNQYAFALTPLVWGEIELFVSGRYVTGSPESSVESLLGRQPFRVGFGVQDWLWYVVSSYWQFWLTLPLLAGSLKWLSERLGGWLPKRRGRASRIGFVREPYAAAPRRSGLAWR